MMLTGSMKSINGLLVLSLVLVICGCSHQPITEEQSRQQMLEEMKAYLEKIPDPNRRDQLSKLMNALKQDLAELNRTVEAFGEDVHRLNANYDATKEDFHKIFDQFNTSRKRLQQAILTSHYKMKELTTADEWEDLADLEEKALSKIIQQNLLNRYGQEV
jgi:septal ring factor EnvC (AmiA/AmiB activator)